MRCEPWELPPSPGATRSLKSPGLCRRCRDGDARRTVINFALVEVPGCVGVAAVSIERLGLAHPGWLLADHGGPRGWYVERVARLLAETGGDKSYVRTVVEGQHLVFEAARVKNRIVAVATLCDLPSLQNVLQRCLTMLADGPRPRRQSSPARTKS